MQTSCIARALTRDCPARLLKSCAVGHAPALAFKYKYSCGSLFHSDFLGIAKKKMGNGGRVGIAFAFCAYFFPVISKKTALNPIGPLLLGKCQER